jgi:tetratricopeptide (TPR) repeat protein
MKRFILTLLLLIIAVLFGPSAETLAQGQGQSGGGTLPGDPSGGAALIFRKPDNPKVSDPTQVASGGRIRGKPKTRAAVVAQERTIAKGNAARSAPVPRYSEAEQEYKLAAQQDPDDARAHAGLGNVYLDQGRFQDAVNAYREALKINSDYAAAYQPLGYSLARLNRYTEATDTLKQGLKYEPGNAEIYNNLAYAYVHAERFSEAVEAGREAINLLGESGRAYKQGLQARKEVLTHAYKNLGNAYNGLKQYNQAADALKQAAAIEPNNAAAYFNLGLALYNGGRYSEAIEAYKAVVRLRPQLAAAHYNLGLTYVAVNDKESARQVYNTLKPLNANMANQLQGLIRQ